MPLIGAHVSAAGGLHKCFERATELGVSAIQIFGASPRSYGAKMPTEQEIKLFVDAKEKFGGPVFLHASYLVNLGSGKSDIRKKSITNLSAHFKIANLLQAEGLIFHIGSAKDTANREESLDFVVEGMKETLDSVSGPTKLVMENAAGGGDKIGHDPEEIGRIFRALGSPRVGVCYDTQHAFAAATLKTYDKKELDDFVKKSDRAFGWENVVALHLNDSKTECGSNHDRHENIGEGLLPKNAFANLAAHPSFAQLPWLLEVPGFDGEGPDKENVSILKKIIATIR